MITMRKAVQRFLALLTLASIKAGLLKVMFRRQQLSTDHSEAGDNSSTNKPPYAELDDTEEKFAAWESERREKLRHATDLEQQGVRLLAQAALLRAAIKCEDRGETFIAEELRELADDNSLGTPGEAIGNDRPILRIVGVEDEALPRGA